MSVSNQTNKTYGSGNGVTVTFSYAFKIFNVSELYAYKINNTTGVVTGPLVYTTDFTATISSVSEGGTITFVVAPTSNETWFLRRIVPQTQSAVIPSEGTLPGKQIENQLDLITMMAIQTNEAVTRCAQLAATSLISAVTLPDPVDGYALAWSGTSGLLVNTLINSQAITAAVVASAASAAASASSASSAAAQVTLAAAQVALAAVQTGLATTQATNAAASAVAAAASAASINLASPAPIGNTTPNTGAFTTLKIGTTHQGDVFFDNGTSVIRLTPGTAGQSLRTQGAAANPIWLANTQIFTASGTFTAPLGITKVFVTLVAGGGGGGQGNGGNGGGGGGSGAFALSVPYTVIPGNAYTVTVGTGGAMGAPGGTGGNSSFDGQLSVNGGVGGVLGGSGGTGGAGGAAHAYAIDASGVTAGILGYISIAGGAGGNHSGTTGGGSGGSLGFAGVAMGVTPSVNSGVGSAGQKGDGSGGSPSGADGIVIVQY